MKDDNEKLVGGIKTEGLRKHSSSENPLVSIITVVYNGETHLEQTIKSVLAQTYTNVEYIVIDGGSTDGTLDILKKYDDKIDYWVSEKDNGIYDAMNKGITQANGELIGIINADDWYEKDAVENIVSYYRSNPAGEVFYGLLRMWHNNEVHSVQGPTIKTLNTMMISHPTCFIKKEVYERYGKFDTTYRIAGDYELMFRLRSNEVSFLFIEKVLANFRLGGVSGSQNKLTIIEKLNIRRKYRIIGQGYFIFKKFTTTVKALFNKF